MAQSERWINYMSKGPVNIHGTPGFKSVANIREEYIEYLNDIYNKTLDEAKIQDEIAQKVVSEAELQAFIKEFFKSNSPIQYVNDFLNENERDLEKVLTAGKQYRNIKQNKNAQVNSTGKIVTNDTIDLSDSVKLQRQVDQMCSSITTKLNIINRILLDAEKIGAKTEDLIKVKTKLEDLEKGLRAEVNTGGTSGILHDNEGNQKYSLVTSLQNIYKAPMGKAWEEVLVTAINSLDFFSRQSENKIIKNIQAIARGGNLEKTDIEIISEKNPKINIPISLKLADYETRTTRGQKTMYTGFHGFMSIKDMFAYFNSYGGNQDNYALFNRLLAGELYHEGKTGQHIAFSRFSNAVKLKEAFQRALAAGVIGNSHTGVLAPRMSGSNNDVVYLAFGKTFVSKYHFLKQLENAKGFAYTPVKNTLDASQGRSIGGVAAYRGGVTPFKLRDGRIVSFKNEFKVLSNKAFQEAGFRTYAFKMNNIKLK